MENDLWLESQLSDACDSIDYGLTASASENSVGPRFLRITDIASGYIDWKSVPYVIADPDTSSKYRLSNGDIVIARTGASTGTSAYIKSPPESVFASYLVRLKTKPGFDSRFVAYYLRSNAFWAFIRGVLGDKSAEPNASAATMTQAPFRFPSNRKTQTAIAQILGALDDKIDLGTRINDTLEVTARALFKSWFVDFDPVRLKMLGPQYGLPKAVADFFPDSFEESELGKIPKGWVVGKLGDVAENPRRGVQPDNVSRDTPYIGLEHMPRRSISLSGWGYAESLESTKFEFKQGEFLFGKLRPYFHKVGVAPLDGVCSTDILVVTPKESDWYGFVLGHISSVRFVDYTNAGSTGTKMPRTSWQEMLRYSFPKPPASTAGQFAKFVHPLVQRIIAGIHQSRTLAMLRDVLLPKLISGELRIEDAERIVGECT